jgi:hypothetical protein
MLASSGKLHDVILYRLSIGWSRRLSDHGVSFKGRGTSRTQTLSWRIASPRDLSFSAGSSPIEAESFQSCYPVRGQLPRFPYPALVNYPSA